MMGRACAVIDYDHFGMAAYIIFCFGTGDGTHAALMKGFREQERRLGRTINPFYLPFFSNIPGPSLDDCCLSPTSCLSKYL